jgi:hypothetical protein
MALYTLKSGDYPWSLAVRFTGNGNRWPELCAANPNLPKHATYGCVFPKIGSNINLPDSWAPASTASLVTTPTSATISTNVANMLGIKPTTTTVSLTTNGQQLIVNGQSIPSAAASSTAAIQSPPGTAPAASTTTVTQEIPAAKPAWNPQYVKLGLLVAGIIAAGFIVFQAITAKGGSSSEGPKTAKMTPNRRRRGKGKRRAKRGARRRMRRNPAESYDIVRMFQKGGKRIVKRGLTLQEAQAHCKDPETSSSTCTTKAGRDRTKRMGPWFDGYQDTTKQRRR